jgi:hypothetical protein
MGGAYARAVSRVRGLPSGVAIGLAATVVLSTAGSGWRHTHADVKAETTHVVAIELAANPLLAALDRSAEPSPAKLGEARRGSWATTEARAPTDPRVSLPGTLLSAVTAISTGPVAQGLSGRGPPSLREP